MTDVTLEQVSAGILAFFTDLSESEQRVSLSLYRLLADGQPVAMRDLARAAGVTAEEAEHTVARWPGVHRAANATVTGYWGLTIKPTRHRMRLGERVLYAWCAWDTLFLPELLGQRAKVQSSCPVSGKKIALEVGPGGVKAGARRAPVSFVAPDPQKAMQDIVSNFCRFVHFFSTNEAGAEWVAQHPGTVLASLEEAWELGRRRNALRYPGRLLSSEAGAPRSANR